MIDVGIKLINAEVSFGAMPRIVSIEEKNKDPSLNLALDTIGIGKQAFVFVNTKRSAEKVAEDIAKKIKTGSQILDEIAQKLLGVLSKPTRQCERLAFCVRKGIAFHHAGLAGKQREIIEDEFRNGTIKIICCTPTLAAGVDLPAFRTIIRDLKRYGNMGLNWIPVLEYLQQAGRAGRPKFDKFGESIAVASSEGEKDKIYEKYVLGEPEEIYSKLAVEPALRTYILSLIASNFVNTKDNIMQFFSKTFWAHQFKDMNKIELLIDRMLELLEEWEFIRSSNGGKNEDFIDASDLDAGRNARIIATPIGKRVAELYLDPYTANYLIKNIRKSHSIKANEFSLLQMVAYTLEMRPLLRPRQKDQDAISEALLKHSDTMLEKEPSIFEPEYEDYLASVKTALFMHDWMEEKDEEFLLESYDIRPGEIRAKLDVADWLLYSSEELSRMMQFTDILREIRKARFRLQYGIREELMSLVRLHGIGRVRARMLFNNKIKNLLDVKNADLSSLKFLLGEKVAVSIKQQVGQDVSKVPVRSGKRKGQIALQDYDEK